MTSKLILFYVGVFCLASITGCLTMGCSMLQDKSMSEIREFQTGAVNTAQDLNATLLFQVNYSGETSLFYKQGVGINTGLSATATFIVMPDDNRDNAANATILKENDAAIEAGDGAASGD